MKIKTLIAAMDAEHLAVEAKKRAMLKSKNKQDQDEVPDLVKKALEEQSSQAQVKHVPLKEKWHPPDYIPVWELLNLTGTYKFKEWSGDELDVVTKSPRCLQISDALDLDNVQELIWYAFSNGFIKEGIKLPPSLSDDDSGVWQDDWLYLHRIGKFIGAKTKEDAIDGWLKEIRFIIVENRRYNSAFKKVDEVRMYLRDMLYIGRISAVRLASNRLTNIPREYWLTDDSAGALSISTLPSDIFFEHKSVQKIVADANKEDASFAGEPTVVSNGRDVREAANAVYRECRLREDKLNNQELQILVNLILKNSGKILPKSWYKTSANIPSDLKRQRGEHGKCSLIDDENWPKSENK